MHAASCIGRMLDSGSTVLHCTTIRSLQGRNCGDVARCSIDTSSSSTMILDTTPGHHRHCCSLHRLPSSLLHRANSTFNSPWYPWYSLIPDIGLIRLGMSAMVQHDNMGSWRQRPAATEGQVSLYMPVLQKLCLSHLWICYLDKLGS